MSLFEKFIKEAYGSQYVIPVYQRNYFDTEPSADSLKEMRDDFLEKEIVIKKDSGCVFAQSYTFGSPSTATDFILGGSNNGWNYWKDSTGQIINDSLRKKF